MSGGRGVREMKNDQEVVMIHKGAIITRARIANFFGTGLSAVYARTFNQHGHAYRALAMIQLSNWYDFNFRRRLSTVVSKIPVEILFNQHDHDRCAEDPPISHPVQ